MRWPRRRRPRPEGVQWVQVAFARHQPEAEMLVALLGELEIPCLVQRAVDVPDMLAGGPRRLLVPADRELEARALLDPYAPIPPEQEA
jgi:Putative prokaryotic signal transducing protein